MWIRETCEDEKTRPVPGGPVFDDQVCEIRITQGRSVLLSSPGNNKGAIVRILLCSKNEVEIIRSGGSQMNALVFLREPQPPLSSGRSATSGRATRD